MLRKATSMRTVALCSALLLTTAVVAHGQPVPTETLRLSVDDAVRLALGQNTELAVERLAPAVSQARLASVSRLFTPVLSTGVQKASQLQPPASLLLPTATRTDVITTTVGISERLPWLGSALSVAWDSSRTTSNSFLNSYNPLLRAGLAVSWSQPLLRDLRTDAVRTQVAVARTAHTVAEAQVREATVRTTAAVKSAYWNLVSARAARDARRVSLQFADELARANAARVDAGVAPPLDLVASQAEVVSNREQLLAADVAVHEAEDALRVLFNSSTDARVWQQGIEPTDALPVTSGPVNVDVAVDAALQGRVDLVRARADASNAAAAARLTGSQRLPDVRLTGSYQANGLGGTEVLRSGGFPGTILGPGRTVTLGAVVDQISQRSYPTWGLGITASYPLWKSSDDANHARATVEASQAALRVRGAETRVVQQVRDAGWKVDMSARRIETAAAARALAEQRRDTEQKRFDAGLSTSFLVIQAQRDLANATQNELAARLAHHLAVVAFETVQVTSSVTR